MLNNKPSSSSSSRYQPGSPFDIAERKKPGTLRQLYLKNNPEVAKARLLRDASESSLTERSGAPPSSPISPLELEQSREKLKSLLVKAGLSEENLSTIDFSSFDLRAEQLTYFERGSKRGYHSNKPECKG